MTLSAVWMREPRRLGLRVFLGRQDLKSVDCSLLCLILLGSCASRQNSQFDVIEKSREDRPQWLVHFERENHSLFDSSPNLWNGVVKLTDSAKLAGSSSDSLYLVVRRGLKNMQLGLHQEAQFATRRVELLRQFFEGVPSLSKALPPRTSNEVSKPVPVGSAELYSDREKKYDSDGQSDTSAVFGNQVRIIDIYFEQLRDHSNPLAPRGFDLYVLLSVPRPEA